MTTATWWDRTPMVGLFCVFWGDFWSEHLKCDEFDDTDDSGFEDFTPSQTSGQLLNWLKNLQILLLQTVVLPNSHSITWTSPQPSNNFPFTSNNLWPLPSQPWWRLTLKKAVDSTYLPVIIPFDWWILISVYDMPMTAGRNHSRHLACYYLGAFAIYSRLDYCHRWTTDKQKIVHLSKASIWAVVSSKLPWWVSDCSNRPLNYSFMDIKSDLGPFVCVWTLSTFMGKLVIDAPDDLGTTDLVRARFVELGYHHCCTTRRCQLEVHNLSGFVDESWQIITTQLLVGWRFSNNFPGTKLD